jgi:hypothetical protein
VYIVYNAGSIVKQTTKKLLVICFEEIKQTQYIQGNSCGVYNSGQQQAYRFTARRMTSRRVLCGDISAIYCKFQIAVLLQRNHMLGTLLLHRLGTYFLSRLFSYSLQSPSLHYGTM